MKVLVTYASKHGSTHEIANTVAEELRNSELDADLLEVSEVSNIAGYDAVIFGSAIYAGNWLPEAKAFAAQYQSELSKLPVWVFSSGPLGTEDPQPHPDPAALIAPIGSVRVREHRVFVGKLDMAELGLGERLITKVVGAPSGDFRNWDEIRAWAHQIAAELRPVGIAAL